MTKEEKQTMLHLATGAWLVWGWLERSDDVQTTIKLDSELVITADEKYDIYGIRTFAQKVTWGLSDLSEKDYQPEEELDRVSAAAMDMAFILVWLKKTRDKKTILSIKDTPRDYKLKNYHFSDINKIATNVENGILGFMEGRANLGIAHCPFCGSEAELNQNEYKEWYIQCKQTDTCGATVGFINKQTRTASGVDSVCLWNKRTTGDNADSHCSWVTIVPDEAKEKLTQMLRRRRAYFKPCPFCGSRSLMLAEVSEPLDLITIDGMGREVDRKEGKGGVENFLSVHCKKCCSAVYFLSADTEESESDVIDRWNRRTNS